MALRPSLTVGTRGLDHYPPQISFTILSLRSVIRFVRLGPDISKQSSIVMFSVEKGVSRRRDR